MQKFHIYASSILLHNHQSNDHFDTFVKKNNTSYSHFPLSWQVVELRNYEKSICRKIMSTDDTQTPLAVRK